MFKRLLSVAMLFSLSAAVPAMAVTAKSAPYVGGELGLAAPSITSDLGSDMGPPLSSTVGGLGWGGFIGYNFALNNNWLVGVELAYNGNGKASYDYLFGGGLDINPYDLDLTATGTYLFTSGWNLFGKAGVARVDQKYSVTDSSYTPSVSSSGKATGTKPIVKVGFGYLFDFNTAGSMNLFAQYTHLFGKSVENDGDTFNPSSDVLAINAIEVGLSYNLPV